MPTSSIFTTVKIKTEEEAEQFLAALEAAEKAPRVPRETPNMKFVSEPEEIRWLFEKRKSKSAQPKG